MKPKRRKSRGFACLLILVFGGAVFVLLSAVVNLHLRNHQANQDRQLALQERVAQQAPIVLTNE